MRAILSDVHGNLEALEAVLADVDARGADEIYCLGDVIGYGPDPCACIDLVKERCVLTLLGNHDQASLFDPEGFNKTAERAIFWTRRTLETSRGGEARFDFLGELPRTVSEDGDTLLFVHGSARNPLNEYVFPEDIYNTPKMAKIFQLIGRRCFQGHTHIPGVFTEDFDFLAPTDLDGSYKFPPPGAGAAGGGGTVAAGAKAMVNVGSVGQPRDGDPRASYVTFDPAEDVVTFHRVEYDHRVTAAKIYDIPELDDHLGDRLAKGQ